MSNVMTRAGLRSFQAPKHLVQSGALAQLSGDALRLFLLVCYEWHSKRKTFVLFHDAAIRSAIRLKPQQILSAVEELERCSLVRANRGADRTSFHMDSSGVDAAVDAAVPI